MKTFICKNISISVDDFGCQVSFSDSKKVNPQDDNYILFQYMADDEVEEFTKGNYCYIESNDETLAGFYKKIDAKLFRDRLFVKLKKNEIVEIQFNVTERKYRSLESVLETLFSGLGKFESIKV